MASFTEIPSKKAYKYVKSIVKRTHSWKASDKRVAMDAITAFFANNESKLADTLKGWLRRKNSVIFHGSGPLAGSFSLIRAHSYSFTSRLEYGTEELYQIALALWPGAIIRRSGKYERDINVRLTANIVTVEIKKDEALFAGFVEDARRVFNRYNAHDEMVPALYNDPPRFVYRLSNGEEGLDDQLTDLVVSSRADFEDVFFVFVDDARKALYEAVREVGDKYRADLNAHINKRACRLVQDGDNWIVSLYHPNQKEEEPIEEHIGQGANEAYGYIDLWEHEGSALINRQTVASLTVYVRLLEAVIEEHEADALDQAIERDLDS